MEIKKKSIESLKKRVKEIIKILRRSYPHSQTALHYQTPFQLLVATILAAQCTDERVNQITPQLFQKYPTIDSLAEAKQEEVEAIIRPTGFFRHKARHLIAAAQAIMENFGGEVPGEMDKLISLPGVARKTANIVLSSAFKRAEGIAVDTHVRRLARRLGLSSAQDPNKIEEDLMAIVPREDWLDFNYLLVDHGRAVCQARRPRCQECVLRFLCPSADKIDSPGARRNK